jgi:hypothetical protein
MVFYKGHYLHFPPRSSHSCAEIAHANVWGFAFSAGGFLFLNLALVQAHFPFASLCVLFPINSLNI